MREQASSLHVPAARALSFFAATAVCAACFLPSLKVDPALDGPANATCGVALSSAACQACSEQACCAQARECALDATCRAFANCVGTCPPSDGACRRNCYEQNRGQVDFVREPAGISSKELDLMQCLESSCAPTCGESRLFFAAHADDCDTCVEGSCSPERTSCKDAPECVRIAHCYERCLNPWCEGGCRIAEGDVGEDFASKYVTLRKCVESKCRKQCYGQTWACVDRYRWKQLDGPPIASIAMKDVQSDERFAGATVKACNRLDLPCATPLATAVTDFKGEAELAITGASQPFSGFLEASGSTLATMLHFNTRPLERSEPATPLTLTPANIEAFSTAVNVLVTPGTGSLLVSVFDCEYNPAAGVEIRATSGSDTTTYKTYYLDQLLPQTAATSTSADGFAIVLNVPPPSANVTATLVGKSGVVAKASVVIRAGAITQLRLFPSVSGY